MLVADLKVDDPAARRGAAGVLGRLGPEGALAVPALAAELPRADPVLTVFLADALGDIGTAAQEAAPALKKKLTADQDETHGADLAVALWRVARDPAAAKALREHLDAARDPAAATAALWRIDPGPDTVTSRKSIG